MNNRFRNCSEKGLTLIELLVVIAISGVVLTAVYSLFTKSNEIYVSQDQIVRVQQGMRTALSRMVRNIRMAGLNPSGNATCAGFNATTNSSVVNFSMDYNGDGSCSDANEKIEFRYSASDNTIRNNSNNVLAKDIVSFGLCYWLQDDSNCTANPTDLEDIRMVDINICGQISGSYSQKYDHKYCMNSTAKCRNL